MTQPPPALPERLQRPAHLVLRERADPAPLGERQPVPSAEAEHDRDGQEQRAGQGRADPHREQSEYGRDDARESEAPGAGETAVLLPAGMIGATGLSAARPGHDHPPMLPPPKDATRIGHHRS